MLSITAHYFACLKVTAADLNSSSFSPVCSPADVVFFIYLYQRWIYRVDPNRVNEFGTSGADHTQNNTADSAGAITDKPEGEKKND